MVNAIDARTAVRAYCTIVLFIMAHRRAPGALIKHSRVDETF
jgi:hypothetical protein